jgi:hypothetical protein
VAKLQSVLPRAFKAVQESDISVYIKDWKAQLHADSAESFTVSQYSGPAMWITQSVMRPIHSQAFRGKIMASKGFHQLDDNPVSNHFLNWALSKYDDAILKFAVGIRLNMLKTPRTIKRDGDRDIQCCWCEAKNPDMAHIMTGCKSGPDWKLMNKRHRAIVDAVAAAVREGCRGVHIRDDVRIVDICASIRDEDGGLKRSDLMYETAITSRGKTKKIFNMTEITCPWEYEDSLVRAYEEKRRKYTPVQIRFQQEHEGIYDEVRLNIIVVSRSGVFLPASQRDFAIATMLPRGRLAAHQRMVVDAPITNAHEHYGCYCRALGFRDAV